MRARVLVLLCLCGAASSAEDSYLDEGETRGLIAYYVRAKHWALKGMVLLALGPRWHRSGAKILTASLRSGDPREKAYAVEALLRTDEDLLRRVASAELVDALVRAQGGDFNAYFGARAREALARIAPAAMAKDRTGWTRWWQAVGEGYEPLRWKEPPQKKRSGRTFARPFLRRLFDLQEAGLEVAVCIDSTGSMQGAIDAARDAILDAVDVLGAVAPRFRIGLVHYRDDMDMSGGASILSPLTRNANAVRAKLARLQADGGGDLPERVANGLELALSWKMGWKRNTNKVVILVGDAPPKDPAKAVRLAREAHERPFGKEPPVSGPGRKLKVRPFVISAIVAGAYARADFKRITDAGGGSVSRLRGGGARVGRRRGGSSAIVKHILVLAFGTRWESQVDAFLAIFNRYREAKYFR